MFRNVLLLCIGIGIFIPLPPICAAPFPVAPHHDVTIEWWYLNAHLTTESGRHLAVVGSFFRVGNKHGATASPAPSQQLHYLLWAVTDLDSKDHRALSLADNNSLEMMKELAAAEITQNPGDQSAQTILDDAGQNMFPPPTTLMDGTVSASYPPLLLNYGTRNSLRQMTSGGDVYRLTLAGGAQDDAMDLIFRHTKPTMLVGGTGNTGIKQPSDMKYVSLTRCRVSGSITTPGQQAEGASGIGWFDHQWGNSWTAQKYGWDWWGIQLLDGTDVLVFQQRDLNTGKTFFPLATFEDEHGHVTVTKKIDFAPDMRALWRSRKTSIVYPLRWKLSFPELKETIWVAPDVHDQEIRVLYGGGSIWEGSCKATAMVHGGKGIKGMAYMELVGYGAPKARKDLDSRMKLLEGGQ